MASRLARYIVLPWLGLLVTACRGSAAHGSPRSSASASRLDVPRAPASAGAESSASRPPTHAHADADADADAGPKPEPVNHCKALGQKGHLTLATIRDERVQISAQGGSLFVLGYTHELARARLLRVSRAGGPVEEIATRSGLGEPRRFVVKDGAAWYTQGSSLFKLGPAPGAAVELARAVHSPVAVAGDFVFVVACDAKGDRLLQIPRDGGAAVTVVTIPRVSQDLCRYSSLVADEREVFVADWNRARVLAVARADGSLRELVSKKGFPSALVLEPEQLVLLSALGLLRVSRAGGPVTRLADETVALAPYSLLRAQGGEYFVYDNLAYSVTNTLYRLPRSGGAPTAFFDYQAPDPAGANYDDNGLRDFDVDDECAYIAQWQYGKPGVQLLARAK